MANGIWIRPRTRPKPDEVWIVYRDAKGGRRREKIGADNAQFRHLAKEVLAKRQYAVASGEHFPKRAGEARTFREMAEKYWELWGCQRDKSWKCRLAQLVLEFGDRKMSELSTADIQAYYNRRLKETSSSNANRNLALLKSVINRGRDWGDFHGESPADRVQRRRDNPGRTRFLSTDEIKKFLSKCDPRLYPLAVCAMMTGMRKMELLRLCWKDVDLEHGNIHVHQTKSGKSREIPISSKLRSILDAMGPRREGKVFEISHMTFRRLFDKARADAELPPFCWHDLRHTMASHFIMKNADLPTLQKIMGQSSFAMVQRYAHLSKGHLKSSMEVFDSAMPQVCASVPKSVESGLATTGATSPSAAR
jgi:integrase